MKYVKYVRIYLCALFLVSMTPTFIAKASEKESPAADGDHEIRLTLKYSEDKVLEHIVIRYHFPENCILTFEGGVRGVYISHALVCDESVYRGPILRDIDLAGGPEKLFGKLKMHLNITD